MSQHLTLCAVLVLSVLSTGCHSHPNRATVVKVERVDDDQQEHIKMVLRTRDREFHVHCDQDIGASLSGHATVCRKYSAGETIEVEQMVGTLYDAQLRDDPACRGWTVDSEALR
jgi:hypothetical protein